MTTWNQPAAPGNLEREVTELLSQADRQGVAPEEVVRATARVLCLLALASRRADIAPETVRAGVMQLVWESLAALGSHPFVAMDRAH